MGTSGPAAGSGFELLLQGFNWESSKEPWYKKLAGQAAEIAEAGFTAVWFPPASDSVSPQVLLCGELPGEAAALPALVEQGLARAGMRYVALARPAACSTAPRKKKTAPITAPLQGYLTRNLRDVNSHVWQLLTLPACSLARRACHPCPYPLQGYLPRDLYDLNSKFGSEAELRDAISLYHELGLKVIADIVINHRCAHYQVGAWVGGWVGGGWGWCGSGGFRLRVPVGRGETWTMEAPWAGGAAHEGAGVACVGCCSAPTSHCCSAPTYPPRADCFAAP